MSAKRVWRGMKHEIPKENPANYSFRFFLLHPRAKPVWQTSCLLVFTAVCCLLSADRSFAAPPTLDVAPAFGEFYLPSRWQTVYVTATNPGDGETVQGEVQVALENKATGERQAAFSRAIALPKGAGTGGFR